MMVCLYHTRRPFASTMDDEQKKVIQERFTRTAELFAQHAMVDSAAYVRRKIEFLTPRGDERALDIACGPGTLALALAPRVGRVCGIDITEKILRLAADEAQAQRLAGTMFVRGDVEQLPFPESSFDLVCCAQSFHHFARPAIILEEMRRVVRRTGALAIFDAMAPEEDDRAALHNQIERIRDPSHTHTLKYSEFLKLFRDSALFMEREEKRPREHWFSKWAARAALDPQSVNYRVCRQMMLDSMAGDRAGFEAEIVGDDIRFIHHEAHFLLRRSD